MDVLEVIKRSKTILDHYKIPQLAHKDWVTMLQFSQLRSIKKGDYFIKAGQTSHQLAFVVKGCFRFFYIKNEVEKTSYFTFENDVKSVEDLAGLVPASFSFAAEAAASVVVQAREVDLAFPVEATVEAVRQVQISAGSLVLLGVALGTWVHPGWYGLAAFVGAGLTFAGLSNTCAMALLLARMPWNR